MHRLQELVRLHRMGTGCREAARLLGMSPNTERDYREAIARAGLLDGRAEELPELDVLRAAVLAERPPQIPPQQVSSVEPWIDEIRAMFPHAGPRAIYDRLRLEHADFTATLSAIKRACVRLRRALWPAAPRRRHPRRHSARRGSPRSTSATRRVGDPRPAALAEVRGCSCWSSPIVGTVLPDRVQPEGRDLAARSHLKAFDYSGGVPVVVPDNL